MPTDKPHIKPSVKTVLRNNSTRVLAIIFLSFFLMMVYFVISGYNTQLKLYEEKELAKLQGIAYTLELQLDGDGHQAMFEQHPNKDDITYNEQDSIYQYFHEVLMGAKENNMIRTNLYTMVYDSSASAFLFGASTAEEPHFRHEYTTYPEKLGSCYQKGGVIEPYKDENGMWLTAFVPLKNSAGKAVGVLMVDEEFSNFIAEARNGILRNILISVLVLSVIAVFMIQATRYLLKQERALIVKDRELNDLRKELMANVSHDLRTPIAVIKGYAETLRMKKESISLEDRNRYLEIMMTNSDRLQKLVDELFELSKLEAEGKRINAEPFPVPELVQDIVSKYRLMAEQKQVQIKNKQDEDLPLAYGDVELIDRVLQNLLDNAIKFCSPGDYIHIETHQENGCIEVKVADSGVGIPSEDLPYIFDRYRKGSNNGSGGTGLGLAIVKKALELHGSEIKVESQTGHGCTFTFELPIYKK